MELPKKYDAHEVEKRLQESWEKEGVYKFNPNSDKPVYSIDTPPPTVSGEMHLGHAFSYAQMDMMARYKRMCGFSVFYPFGTDDNGIATERLVEKINNVKAAKMDRYEFKELCLKTLKKIRPQYINDWKSIGMACDWDIYYTTIDDHCQRISQRSFIELYKMGREYRKESPFIWCPQCQTAISQVEMEDKELSSTFNDVIFKVGKEDVIISTTRPELLPSCVAVFIHPDDKKNAHLIGKKAKVPLFDLKVPIILDKRVDMEKGTGVVMCCTFGDQTDVEWYLAHKLPLLMSITKDGKMNENAGKYKGLEIRQAREAIIDDLGAYGLLTGQKKITHNVNVHERCKTEIEIINTKQWFIKYLDLKDEFLKRGKELKWYPEYMRHRYDNWIDGLQWDWCISRQRYSGIPFPVWYCKKCEEVILADEKKLPVDPLKDKPDKPCPKCGSDEFEPEKDVLDTWATSSLTPRLAAELYKDSEIFEKIYPMSLRPQAHDIITFWLFNTVVKSHLHDDSLPWKDVVISGFALDSKRRKMSKSMGNVIRPQDAIEKYSADSLRFWAACSSLGDDLPFLEKDLVTGQKFITKMWNASKFALMHLENFDGEQGTLRVIDKWILSKLNNIVKESTNSFEKYEYSKTKALIENFYWHVFCDHYLEIIKDRLYNPDNYGIDEKKGAQYALYNITLNVLKLLAPILPHITDEIYQKAFAEQKGKKSVHLEDWPEFKKELKDEDAEKSGDLLIKVLSAIRQFKQGKNMSLGAEVSAIYIKTEDADFKKSIKDFLLDLQGASRAKKIEITPNPKGKKIDVEGLPLEIYVEL